MKRIRFWVSLFCIIFGALESRLQLGVKRNMSNWQLYICIFIKRLDSTSADRFSGSISFFFAIMNVLQFIYDLVRNTVRRRVHLKECYNEWLNFFFFFVSVENKRGGVCVPSYFHIVTDCQSSAESRQSGF